MGSELGGRQSPLVRHMSSPEQHAENAASGSQGQATGATVPLG